jgi:hypothetical protein
MSAHIARLSLASNGHTLFTLDNGQVWRQLLGDTDVSARPGDSVRISRGVFNSYWLQVQSGRGCKVARVR